MLVLYQQHIFYPYHTSKFQAAVLTSVAKVPGLRVAMSFGTNMLASKLNIFEKKYKKKAMKWYIGYDGTLYPTYHL